MSQNEGEIPVKQPYKFRKNQHVISYSPLAFFGYNYAYSFNPHLTYGVGISLGLNYYPGYRIPSGQLAKVAFFYRNYVRDNTYFNLGIVESILLDDNLYRLIGMESEIFYGWNQIKIGHGVQAGFIFDEWGDYKSDVIFPVFNPIIIQINLPRQW